MRAALPALTLETCASGGGRMGGAILAHAHTNWISDQPQAVAKLAVHFGIQRAHPAVCCNDWLVDWPPRAYSGVDGIDARGDLAFRLSVAMLGSFGISAPIDQWPEQDLALAAQHVALYRTRLRKLTQHGDQYQLTDPPPLDSQRANGDAGWAARSVAKDGSEAVLFAFRLEGYATASFPTPGLRAGPRHLTGDPATLHADTIAMTLPATFRSAVLLVSIDTLRGTCG